MSPVCRTAAAGADTAARVAGDALREVLLLPKRLTNRGAADTFAFFTADSASSPSSAARFNCVETAAAGCVSSSAASICTALKQKQKSRWIQSAQLNTTQTASL